MRESIKNHGKILVVYLLAVMLVGFKIPTGFRVIVDWLSLWIGGVLGMALLPLDRLIHVYVERPEEQLSLQIRQLVKSQKYQEAAATLYLRRGEQYHLAFRNAVFAAVFLLVVLFAFTSSPGMLVKGLTAGVMVHFLYDAWRDYLKRLDHFKAWFMWMVRREYALGEQKVVLTILTLLFAVFSWVLV